MDLQIMLNNAMVARRAEEMKTSPQLTLGELILKLEAIDGKGFPVIFDVEPYRPINIDSWRGSYCELALKYVGNEYEAFTVTELLRLLRSVIGRTFIGYKGGEYLMGKITPIWVANYGDSMGFRKEEPTAVIDVLEKEGRIIIKTKALEY